MHYCKAKIEQETEQRLYRIYITDVLKSVYKVNVRFYDLVRPAKQERKTSAEIIAGIRAKLGEEG